MPVLIKIAWIFLILVTFFSLFGLTKPYNDGFGFVGNMFYGMYAINSFFIIRIAIPVLLIIGIYRCYKWAFYVSVLFFLFVAINNFLNLNLSQEMGLRLAEQIGQEIPDDIQEDIFWLAIKISISATLITNALLYLTLFVFMLVKRKYFINSPDSGDSISTNENQE